MEESLLRPLVKEIKDYVPGKNATEPGMIKLASNENPFGPSPKALEAITKEASKLHIYPDQKAVLLRDSLSKTLGIESEKIIVGNGSDEIMQIAIATCLKPGEEVIISSNTFSVYEFVTRLFDGSPVFVPLNNYEQDLNSILKAISPKTKAIFLCNPHNPTGTYISNQKLNAFLTSVPDNILVVVDEAYAEFAEAADFPTSLEQTKKHGHVLILRTFSKYYGLAGLRVGYGIACPELIHYMFRTKLPFNVGRLAQVGATAALEDKEFLAKTFQNNSNGKKYLYAELDRLGLDYKKTEANFIFINIKKSADEMFMELMRAGIIIRPLTSFGLPEAIRVSIGTEEQNKKLILAFSQTF